MNVKHWLVNEVRRAYYAILQSQSELESQRALLAYLEELQQFTVDVCTGSGAEG